MSVTQPRAGIIRETLQRPVVRVIIVLHVVLAIVLSFIPLFDILGFERAFATGLLSTFTSPIIGVAMVRRVRERGGGDLARTAAYAMLFNLGLLVPALFAGMIVEAVGTSCNQQEGFFFLLLLSGGNAVFGTALGIIGATFAYRRGVPAILIVGTLVVFLGLALWRLYSEPQIFIFSMPFGYWPGSLYDEAIAVTPTLWAFRIHTFILSVAAVAVVRAFLDRGQMLADLARPRPTALAGVIILLAASYLTRTVGEDLGYDLRRESIVRVLSRTAETEHFIIHLDPIVSNDQVTKIKADHELRYAQLSRFFKTHPKAKIRSFIYRDVNQKAQLMGAANTQIARPWATEIHINGYEVPHRVLKHELAHIFAAELSPGMFGVPTSGLVFVNIGIVEGIAVAADWRANELSVHGWTRAMRALQLAPDVRNTLDVAGFWSISSSRAYTVAGSFVRYLVEQYGIEKFGILYAGNDFQLAYGRSLSTLATEWEQYVDALPLPKGDLLIAEHRFKQPGIFQKVCAHETANLRVAARAEMRAGNLESAIDKFERVLEYAPGDTRPLIDLANTLGRRGNLDRADAFARRALESPGGTQKSHGLAEEALATIAWRRQRTVDAKTGFSKVLVLHLSSPSDRLQLARLAALERPFELQEVLRAYLSGDLKSMLALVRLSAAAHANPDDALVRYLLARLQQRARAYPEAIASYVAALHGGLPGGVLEQEARLMLGRTLLDSGQFDRAANTFEGLAEFTDREAVRIQALDWADRAKFLRATRTSSAAE